MPNSSSNSSPPLDQAQREMILTRLDQNILVEAAAGTGKTTSLVGRMVALLSRGMCKVGSLAAVTFTKKAAAELRGRFQVALERAAREARGEERQLLGEALAQLDLCFIGTIHSFCARILRERPVEAGVDLAFEELDPESDHQLRSEAWAEAVASLVTHDPQEILSDLQEVGLTPHQLLSAFRGYADFSDVDHWPVPGPEVRLPPLAPVQAAIRSYIGHMEQLTPRLPSEAGSDPLIHRYLHLPRAFFHLENFEDPRRVMEFLARCKNARPVQKNWTKEGRFTKEDVRDEAARWNSFCETYVQPLQETWRQIRYRVVIKLMEYARQVYDRIRHQRRHLSYQDLLSKTAALLRSHPAVRRYFARRFSHLLVDEFQDTDPIQAEVMMLLTATDAAQADWRRCQPRPGSLFVVGDPKQSIYRFRRADIMTYNAVKAMITRDVDGPHGGLVLQLSTNFRTSGSIVDWVNHAFTHSFPGRASDQSPAYVPLQIGRDDGPDGDLSGVRVLRIPKERCRRGSDAVSYEAEFIARFIRRALDQGLTVTRTSRQLEAGKSPQVSAADFMIVTARRANLGIYARRLQELGIPHQVTGGGVLNEGCELEALLGGLRAVLQPDDPTALVAALRGFLFGVSDTALYAFSKAGGRFSYRTEIPAAFRHEDRAALDEAFQCLKQIASWFNRLPPIAALEKMTARLGLFVHAGVQVSGEMEIGRLAKALELARGAQREMWSTAQLVEFLERLVQRVELADGISALAQPRDQVRIMNLHKVKGLEAPVVFLADPTHEHKFEVESFVDRSARRAAGYISIKESLASSFHRPVLAHPQGWADLAAREATFLEAEALRLRYVAATRAGSLLVITQKSSYAKKNPWHHFEGDLTGTPELVDPGEQQAPAVEPREVSLVEIRQAEDSIAARLTFLRRKTFDLLPAKKLAQISLAGEELQAVPDGSGSVMSLPDPGALDGERGMMWGNVIHQMLQRAMLQPAADLKEVALTQLEEQDLDAEYADAVVAIIQSVMGSDIWQRARRSEECLLETPFQLLWDQEGGHPRMVRGVIDLMFREGGGWVLVDYKTEPGEGSDLTRLAQRHLPQMRLYAEAWRRCCGAPVHESGLFFTQAGSFIRLRSSAQYCLPFE